MVVMHGNIQKRMICHIDVINRFIGEANDMGIYFFVITGGEPFVWPQLYDFLARHNDSFFQIYTNGTCIDE